MRALLLLVPLVAAGCVSLPAAPIATPDEAGNVLPWTLTRCTYLVGWSPADPAKLQARVPEGFSVRTTSVFGVVPTPRANLGTEVFECERGSGLDGEVQTMAYGSIFYIVEVPEELQIDGIDLYMIKEEILVPDDARRELLFARGLSVHAGSIAWESSAGPVGSAARLSLEGYGDFVLSIEAPQSAQPGDGGEFIEFTPTPNGLAAWRASFAWDEGEFATGRGTIHWPEGSWAADAVGTSRAPAQFHRGTWSFNGTITLPPRAP